MRGIIRPDASGANLLQIGWKFTKNAGTPQVLVITLSVGRAPSVLRTVRVTPRNQ
jgi:hypothetical protein